MKQKFQTLLTDHERYVYSLAAHILHDRAEAEDVTQEVFIRLWNNIALVEVPRAKGWLATVTKRICIDHLRRRKTGDDITDDISDIENDIACTAKEPSSVLVNSRLSEWLKTAIDSLAEPYRTLFILRELEQKSHNDIASSQAISTNQVKVYLHRARQHLKRTLQKVDL